MVELRFLFLFLFFRNMSIMITVINMQSNKTGTRMLIKVDLDAETFDDAVSDVVSDVVRLTPVTKLERGNPTRIS